MSRYKAIKEGCLQNNILYEDPEFPASPKSLYFSKVDPRIVWKRPRELCSDPVFMVGGSTRCDLDQGSLGDCWYIAAAATLATRPELLDRVVSKDQHFGKDYAGVFHFSFWRYGQWTEVIIDDRLPTYKGRQLYFCNNRENPNEFWSALMEKAYAKLHGSYEALEGGWTEDAMVDFTGGLGMTLELRNRDQLPPDLFGMLLRQEANNCLLGCSIRSSKETMESELPNGLIVGHAYSITKVAKVIANGKENRLLRLRNPWGKKEWKGPWGDGSPEWKAIDSETKHELGLVYENDGEFWISYSDWLANYEDCQICFLPPGCPSAKRVRHWSESAYHGSWIKGVSAGGCGNPPYANVYWSNPQFSVTLKDLDEPDQHHPSTGKCTLIVSLMQKFGRLKRTQLKVQNANAAIGFDLYQLKDGYVLSGQLTEEHFTKYDMKLQKRSGQYQYIREVSHIFHLDPGVYVVIPSTFKPDVQADFLLRFYTESAAESIEMDTPSGPIYKPKRNADTLKDLFKKWAGQDGVIDSRELKGFLNDAFQQELDDHNQFETETARSLLVMMDRDQSGVLEFDEIQNLWTELNIWRQTFHQFDVDQSGFVESIELRSIFKSVGYQLSRKVTMSIVRRYGGKDGRLTFNDLVIVMTKTISLIHMFAERTPDGLKGRLTLTLDDFMELGMYY